MKGSYMSHATLIALSTLRFSDFFRDTASCLGLRVVDANGPGVQGWQSFPNGLIFWQRLIHAYRLTEDP